MTNIVWNNIKITKYSPRYIKAEIINKGCSKRNLAVGIFTIDEVRQWKEVVRAFEEQVKEL